MNSKPNQDSSTNKASKTVDNENLNRKTHRAHQGRVELKHWQPDPQWFHPMVCSSVVNLSRLLLGKLNTIQFEGRERWDKLFGPAGESWEREDGRGLLSFSNHVSLFDDPLLISNLGATQYAHVRWIAADHINFFDNRLKGLIYSAGKCVPIIRGGGLNQPGFDFLVERLKKGEWVHIFPEGGRSREKDHRLQLPLKIGIGKLIFEANPVLMPFYHYGMQNILPIGAKVPKTKKTIKVLFGEACTVNQAWWQARLSQINSETELQVKAQEAWQSATKWVEDQLLMLEKKVHPYAQESSD